MADRLQIRRDTAANWTSANPTLAQGEWGYEIDENRLKIGDGVLDWINLPYFAGGGSGYVLKQVFTYSASNVFTLSETPSDIIAVDLRGQVLDGVSGLAWSLSGNDVTVLYDLEVGDSIQIIYTVGSIGGSAVTTAQSTSIAQSVVSAQKDQSGGIAANDTSILSLNTVDDLSTSNRINRTRAYVNGGGQGGSTFTYIPSGSGFVADGGVYFDAQDGGLWKRDFEGAVNPKWFGAIGDGINDDTSFLVSSLAYDSVLWQGDFKITSPIDVGSNKKIELKGSIRVDSPNLKIIRFNGSENSVFKGGYIESMTPTATQTGISLDNFTRNCVIENVEVVNFRNKGIDINTGSRDNVLRKLTVSGATSTTGSGISIFGAGADRPDKNIIEDCEVHSCRAGVSVQGAYFTKLSKLHIRDCTLWGLGFDGVVTASGDGAKYSIAQNITIERVSGTGFGGVYMGNGSSFNQVIGAVLNDCYNAVRTSGNVGYEPSRNSFSFIKINGNTDTLALGVNGFNLSKAEYANISFCSIRNVSSRGVYVFNSDNVELSHCRIENCAAEGIYVQSFNTVVDYCISKSNNYGIRFEFGGSFAAGNRVTNSIFEANTTENVHSNSRVNYFLNNVGFDNAEIVALENASLDAKGYSNRYVRYTGVAGIVTISNTVYEGGDEIQGEIEGGAKTFQISGGGTLRGSLLIAPTNSRFTIKFKSATDALILIDQ